MDYCETKQGSKVRILLTAEELHTSTLEDLCNKCMEWLVVSKENKGGRKTRSANRRSDLIYDEIMAFKLPPIKLKQVSSSPVKSRNTTNNASKKYSVDSSADSDSEASSTLSRPITRSLRPRSRTPVVHNERSQPQQRQLTSPSTPIHQRLRANMKQPASGNSSNGSSNVLSAALNQQHPSVSVTKIRQLLRADSAQKRREEEKERHERLRVDRKAKEERAEAQKKQLLEERAVNAKLKREQRLLHAAEIRKAREEARMQSKAKEDSKKPDNRQALNKAESKSHYNQIQDHAEHQLTQETNVDTQLQTKDKNDNQEQDEQMVKDSATNSQVDAQKQLNETFQKPSPNADNIDISIHGNSSREHKERIPPTAAWARAPHLREALIKQFAKPEAERNEEVSKVFRPVKLPVELEQIFGPNQAASTRYLCRTSSAVWTPPHRALKRTSSMVNTPSNDY